MKKSVWPARSGVFATVLVVFAVFLVGLFSLLAGGGALAQESTESERLTILITASRFAETVDETLAPVTLITREDIEQKQAATVEEVLRTVPGLTFGNNGGVGQPTSLFLRGTNSKHVLVLIDGVKVGNATSGSTPFEHLPLDQIEKIEVVRGPRSSLYGSEAIGGVIQIFTRKGRGNRAQFSVSAGSHDARKTNFGVSHGERDAWFNIGVSTENTEGYDACRASFCRPPSDDTGNDDDGYKNLSTSLRGGAALSEAVSIEGNFLESESETEFDGSANESETVTRVTSVKGNWRVSERWQTSLLLGQSRDESTGFYQPETRQFMAGIPEYIFDTTREQINWQNNFRLSANNLLVAGVDYLDDGVDGIVVDCPSAPAQCTSNDFVDENSRKVDSRDNIGVFALWRTQVRANDWEWSLRKDDNEQFGAHTTGSLAWGRDFDEGARITASYGTAFAAPTFNELYWPVTTGFQGNPDLEPEKSKSVNLGFSQTRNNGRVAVNFYQTKIDDLIANDDNSTPQNIKKAEITGIEISGDLRAGVWDLAASVTMQKSIDADTKKDLVRRPRRKMDLDVSHRFGKYRIGANLYSQSGSKDTGDADIDGFATLNLRAAARWHKNWNAEIKINNVTDTEYETAAGYPQDGRNLITTLRYVPD